MIKKIIAHLVYMGLLYRDKITRYKHPLDDAITVYTNIKTASSSNNKPRNYHNMNNSSNDKVLRAFKASTE